MRPSSITLRSSASMMTAGTSHQARQLGGPPAALSGDDLVIAGGEPADGEGLDDPVDADGVGQILRALLVKPLPGLLEARFHLGDGQRDGAALLGFAGRRRPAERPGPCPGRVPYAIGSHSFLS